MRRRVRKYRNRNDVLIGADGADVLVQVGIEQRLGGIGLVLEQDGDAENAEARIDAGVEVHRRDDRFHGAELHALDHAEDVAQLALRKHLHFDAAVRVRLDGFLHPVGPLMLHVLERAETDLHGEFRRIRRRRKRGSAEQQRRTGGQAGGTGQKFSA